MAGQSANKVGSLSPAAIVEVFEAFAEGANIDVEYLDLGIGIVLFDHQGALNGIHTADVGAIGLAAMGGPGAHTLHKTN